MHAEGSGDPLKPEDMVSTVFIFSDMELDQATGATGCNHSSMYPAYGDRVKPEPTNFKAAKVSSHGLPESLFVYPMRSSHQAVMCWHALHDTMQRSDWF